MQKRTEAKHEEARTKVESKHNLYTCEVNREEHEYNRNKAYVLSLYIEKITKDYRSEYEFAQQYSLKKGLGKKGEDAIVKEMRQQHERKCFQPILVSELTKEERRKAQLALAYLSEKRDGMIKGRTVFNGKPTREWLSKEESKSPMVLLEALNTTVIIDGHERRDVMTADIPNAFIQAELERKDGDKKVIMKITGRLVDIMMKMSPSEYEGYVVYKKGKPVIYVQVLQALYGMLVAALLYYKKFRKDVEEIGFIFNPYDACVANWTINKKQHTIRFHVDDLMSSHVDKKVNDRFLEWLNMKYGSFGEVKAT